MTSILLSSSSAAPAGSVANVVEDRLLHHGDHPVAGRCGTLAAHQYRRSGLRQLCQDLPQQLLADETGHAGHHDLLAGKQISQPSIEMLNVEAAGLDRRCGHACLLSGVLASCAATRASSMVKRPT